MSWFLIGWIKIKEIFSFLRNYLNLAKKIVFVEQEEVISGGNFHGEYPAKVSITDYRQYRRCHISEHLQKTGTHYENVQRELVD